MLNSLRFKNWRSLRDVTMEELTPITVLIGANSSGKTNILDGLYFLREMMGEGVMQAVYNRGGGEKIRPVGTPTDTPIAIEFRCTLPEYETVTDRTEMIFSEKQFEFRFKRTLLEGDRLLEDGPFVDLPLSDFQVGIFAGDAYDHARKLAQSLKNIVTTRWQLLDENFMPHLNLASTSAGDIYVIDRCADNVVFMLDFMHKTKPELYAELQDDFRYLLGHVSRVVAERDEREAKIAIHETSHPDIEAPTISAGTARILAMLAAVYALDMTNAAMPGLVVIEEPDTSLNPWLHEHFVDQLRNYVGREVPRQFILTTHNPAFLNYFKPDEVRVVTRGEDGSTLVQRVPEHVTEIWLDEYGLGEVWTTGSLGGIPG